MDKSQALLDDSKHHMTEHAKYSELADKLRGKIKSRRELDEGYKTPSAADEMLLDALARMDHHGKQYRDLAEAIRQAAERDEAKVEKSLMGNSEGQGVAIDTADQAIVGAASADWLARFQAAMRDFSYGDAPRTIKLNDRHSVIMVKVDDGLYSGFVKRYLDEDGASQLEENVAKIEQQTLADAIQYLKSREYLEPVTAAKAPVIPVESLGPPQLTAAGPSDLDKRLELARILASILV